MIDYYKTLGLPPDPSGHEIKQRYRELVLEYHPDINSDPAAEARIKEITEAYSVLSDPVKRAAYDNRLSGWKHTVQSSYENKEMHHNRKNSSQTNNSNAVHSIYVDDMTPEESPSDGLFDQFLKIVGMLAILWILLRRPTIIIGIVLVLLVLYVLWLIMKELFLLFAGKK